MTVLKQYNAGTSTWDAIVLGLTGPAGPVQPFVDFISQNWYGPQGLATSTAVTCVANRTYYTMFYVNKTTTFDRIACVTGSTFSGTATVRLGIYNSDSTGKPTTVVLDAGTVSATAATTNYAITISQTLAAGQYFLAANTQTAATTNTLQGNAAQTIVTVNLPFSSSTATTYTTGWQEDSITGAFATAVSPTIATTTGAARLRAL